MTEFDLLLIVAAFMALCIVLTVILSHLIGPEPMAHRDPRVRDMAHKQ